MRGFICAALVISTALSTPARAQQVVPLNEQVLQNMIGNLAGQVGHLTKDLDEANRVKAGLAQKNTDLEKALTEAKKPKTLDPASDPGNK